MLKPIAKAVAAVVAPFAVAAVNKFAEKAGIPTPIDPSLIDTIVVAVISGVAVWATRNRPAV